MGVSGVAESGQWQYRSEALIGQVGSRGVWMERDRFTRGYAESAAGEFVLYVY